MDKRKKFLAVITGIVIVTVIVLWKKIAVAGAAVVVLVGLFVAERFYSHKYYTSCYEGTDNCVTVITYTKTEFVDRTYKRFIVNGKKHRRVPLEVPAIEFYDDTSLVVMWDNAGLVTVIANQEVKKTAKISEVFDVKITEDSARYEDYIRQHPEWHL